MHYPCLVFSRFCTTPISVEIEQDGLNKYGEPLGSIVWNGNANYQESTRAVYTEEKKVVECTGVCLIQGDIAPTLSHISGGAVTIGGIKHRIVQGAKWRNPDGTVNYTRLDVI